jgi:SAM-dependent methyltransferase
MKCGICDNPSGNREYVVREMMYGTGEEFRYLECSVCGCLQIVNPPDSMDKYYPQDYLSFGTGRSDSSFAQRLKRQRNEYVVFHTRLLGRIVYLFSRRVPFSIDVVRDMDIHRDWRILDVGCGNGRSLLYPLSQLGCKHLYGIDAYIEGSIDDGTIHIRKGTIHELSHEEPFDLIVLSHTLEHVPDQSLTLKEAGDLLARSGVCLIRIPIKSEYIWTRYGVNWIQIDAPRHLFIHTLRSMDILTKKAGLRIREVVFDSTDMQFWGSEQYAKGISYTAANSYVINPSKSIFSARQIKQFRRMAKELNLKKQGDQAAFHLVRDS